MLDAIMFCIRMRWRISAEFVEEMVARARRKLEFSMNQFYMDVSILFRTATA